MGIRIKDGNKKYVLPPELYGRTSEVYYEYYNP